MKIHKLLLVCILLSVITAGFASATDNTSQNGTVIGSDSVEDENCAQIEKISSVERENSNADNSNETSSHDRYYLFRGDCWTVDNNFESSAAVTSETINDLSVTGTFRTQNDLIGLYWNSKDPIQHPYISYGNRSDYSNVILEFDYEMTGCRDLTNTTFTIASNKGETYFLEMSRFIENGHVTLNFNNLTLMPGNSYLDMNGQPVIVEDETALDVSDLKYIMISILPNDFIESNGQYTIMENTDFSCKISNITVANGEICDEQPPLDPHQYRLCEGYDDSYNLNPFRLSKEMRKLGYVDWVDLYIGASHYYEKIGNIGDVIYETGLNHERTEKMVLDKNVTLNKAFVSWLDCYSRELKNNCVENIIISVSIENLQCPESWRQMDLNGNFAMSGWQPSTFLYSPCNDEAVRYMQNVSEACLDIVVKNGFNPVLQMAETWWWWNETAVYFYDNSTKEKYLEEHNSNLPEYDNALSEYDNQTVGWLNQQLVIYSDALRDVIKGEKYSDGLYLALFYPPSVTDSDNIPKMIRDVNYIKDAYSPNKLDILQIEDYDWVIHESSHHCDAYAIGEELGFKKSNLHYFGGFVQFPQDASKLWELIEKSMEDALEKDFSEVFVWAGSQVRRDSKIIGYDEYSILKNLLVNNEPGFVKPLITAPDYVSVCENFTIKMQTNEWANGVLNVYEYENCKKGNLLSSDVIENGFSSVELSSTKLGLNRFYLEFDYVDGQYHLLSDVYVMENSKNISVDVSDEIEIGSDLTITFTAPESSSKYIHISVDGNTSMRYLVEDGKFKTTISNLSEGYHTVLVKYNDGVYCDEMLVGEVYYKTFNVKAGIRPIIKANDINSFYNSNDSLLINLKDSQDNALNNTDLLICFDGKNHTVTTDGDGNATFSIDAMPGTYYAEILYAGDDVYISSYAMAKVVVNRLSTSLASNSINVVYGNSANLLVLLKDANGKPLVGQHIIINLNKKTYDRTTDKNGQVKLSANLAVASYSAKITFAGDDIHKSASCTSKVVVKKATPKLTASSKTFKAKAKTKKVYATIKLKNKAIKNLAVKLTVNKKTYKAKTNSKGIATFKVKLSKKGKYNAVYRFLGNSNFKAATKKVKITLK